MLYKHKIIVDSLKHLIRRKAFILIISGIIFAEAFNVWAVFYFILGAFLLAFEYSFYYLKNKKISVIYGSIIIAMSLFLSLTQAVILYTIIALGLLTIENIFASLSKMFGIE